MEACVGHTLKCGESESMTTITDRSYSRNTCVDDIYEALK